jgi:hypothetical protein
MKRIDLIKVEHSRKMGEVCEYIEPNVNEDCIFYLDGEPIGFYISKMPEKMCKLADLANVEFRSSKVPKTTMSRATVATKEAYELMKTDKTGKQRVDQYSTILGGIPPKAQFKRPYPNLSSVHSVKTAQTFIKAMLLLAKESEQLIKEILPKQYEQQIELFKDVPEKWKLGNLFTSSISNYNISAPFHRDTGNIVGAVNVIICKKFNSKGGDLHIPDYNATIGQQDNSILVYPAWRNVHGVTPIIPTFENGYRNSLIFYPLKAFKGLK